MSSSVQQLSDDFEQVKKLLETYPDIKIIKIKGDPPEQYDIEYTIKGYKIDADGSPAPDNKHEVRITLPFGYPHFPPTAKPITQIFHPDIDPDAIRIADFWQNNHSLPELIIHIGQMICGNHYTRDEPFNQNAFEWFEERTSWLPFDILEPRDEDETPDEETAKTEPASEDNSHTFVPAKDLDILKDDIDFPFDEDEQGDQPKEDISFDLEENTPSVDLTGLAQETEEDDISLDFEGEVAAESFDIQDIEEEITDDLFGLGEEKAGDEIAIDLAEEPGPAQSEYENAAPVVDLFDLETEATDDTDGADMAVPLESDDISTAFEEEAGNTAVESEPLDRNLADLADIDQEDELDLGSLEEPVESADEASIDLSGLEEMPAEGEGADSVPEPDQSGDEEKILSALSLDEEFTATERIDEQSQNIRSLIEQKQIFSAKKLLADFPEPDSLPDIQEFELTINDAVSEAEELYKKADKNEKQGEFEKAGILLDLVANIAADFPGLDFARNRIRESMMEGGKKKADAEPGQEAAGQDQEIEPETETTPDRKKKKVSAKMGFTIPARLILLIIAGILLTGLAAATVYVYDNDSDSIQIAGTILQRAEQLVDRKEFKDAEKELNSAGDTLKKVLFFLGAEKKTLSEKITEITESSMFKEGLQGRVLYGDQYVSVETAKDIDKFNSQKKRAEQLQNNGQLDQAIAMFENAISSAEQASLDEEVDKIDQKIKKLRLQSSLSQAKELEKKGNWLAAGETYLTALELSKGIASQDVQRNISDRLANSRYHQSMDAAVEAINKSQWEKSIKALENAQVTLKENPQIVPETEIIEIDKLLTQSKLYQKLLDAKMAFEKRQWEQAITGYDSAVEYMRDNKTLLGEKGTEGISKIHKAVLNTQVAREQMEIVSAQQKKNQEKALDHYRKIVELIENSDFRTDETLNTILADARTKTEEIKQQIIISNREKWLKNNYEEIFLKNYPSARSSELLNPKIQFVKKENDSMIFSMSCTELKQGRKYNLTLNYQFDTGKESWSLYSGKLDK